MGSPTPDAITCLASLSRIEPMTLTKRIQKLADWVSSEFNHLSTVGPHARFEKFLSTPERINKFKKMCDGLVQGDMSSLGLDHPEKLNDQEFQVRKLVLELIEGTGKHPSDKIPLETLALSGKTHELISKLRACCIVNDWETGETIVAKIGANVLDHHMQTPLMYAVGNHRLEAVKMLLRNGADPNLITPKLKTAMHGSATTNCSQEIFNLLREAGGTLDIQDANGQTASQLLQSHDLGHWLLEEKS